MNDRIYHSKEAVEPGCPENDFVVWIAGNIDRQTLCQVGDTDEIVYQTIGRDDILYLCLIRILRRNCCIRKVSGHRIKYHQHERGQALGIESIYRRFVNMTNTLPSQQPEASNQKSYSGIKPDAWKIKTRAGAAHSTTRALLPGR